MKKQQISGQMIFLAAEYGAECDDYCTIFSGTETLTLMI
jgi:hypothetical protein